MSSLKGLSKRPHPRYDRPQTLTLFAALTHGRVYLVLAWTALGPHLQALQLRRLAAGASHCPLLYGGHTSFAVTWSAR